MSMQGRRILMMMGMWLRMMMRVLMVVVVVHFTRVAAVGTLGTMTGLELKLIRLKYVNHSSLDLLFFKKSKFYLVNNLKPSVAVTEVVVEEEHHHAERRRERIVCPSSCVSAGAVEEDCAVSWVACPRRRDVGSDGAYREEATADDDGVAAGRRRNAPALAPGPVRGHGLGHCRCSRDWSRPPRGTSS